MNIRIILPALLFTLVLSTFAQANDNVNQIYNAQKYQQVCKGKTEGAAVSFTYKGVLWNGTCQPQFFATKSSALKGDEKELNSICKSDPKSKSINIEGVDIKGQCALGFSPPQPR